MPIITPIARNERRQIQHIVQKTSDKNHTRHHIAMLMLYRGEPLTHVVNFLSRG